MKEYKIERWDAILYNNQRYPLIYITPDRELKEFLDDNNYFIKVEIKGTHNYSGRLMKAKVNLSSNYPNCRPNYYEMTGQYVLLLNIGWSGYPEVGKLGFVKFHPFF